MIAPSDNKTGRSHPLALARFLLHSGTRGLDIPKANQVTVINTLSLTTALLAGSFAGAIFLFSGDYGVLAAGLIETLLFSCFIALNHFGHYRLSRLLYMAVHYGALFYFAVLRGMVAEERLLLVFLLICSLLVFSRPLDMGLSIGAGSAILLFGRVNEHLGLLPVTAMDPRAISPFQDLGTIALFILIAVAVSLFKWQDTLLIKKLSAANENLEGKVRERTRALEEAAGHMRFFYNQLSHDMRDKLFSLEGISRLLAGSIRRERPDTLAFYAGRQQVAISALQEMVSDILTLKLISEGRHSPVVSETIVLRPWLQDMVSVYQFNADRRQVKVHLFLDENLPQYLVTDKVKLDKILSNLVGNAIKYTSTQVKIIVRPENGRLLVTVTDNGPGLASDQMERLFDKNYSGDSGTGLGLYIARWLCELMGISIHVASAPGKGTSFLLDCPLVVGSSGQVQAPEEAEEPLHLEGKRILVADDVYNNRFVLVKNLQAAGCQVFEAENGAQMLHIAAAQRPDLILMDNQMPVLSGLEALELLRADEELRSIRVVLVTASSAEEDNQALLQADVDELVTKPVNMRRLLRCVSRLVSAQPVSSGGAHG